ncbi:mechanosensitive ion channel family protein [Planctomycetes bacterium TBK1r]|uniref:Mechanosensitive channel MscS n=1 Tax=Stieleria magnilauensis TaxID=2527963 RepID=A0ABX5XV61_9BACT|nr:mechanosensitive channel MscS [Planctomycetes bacterium TBK1r]
MLTNIKNLLNNTFLDKGLELAVAIVAVLLAAMVARRFLLRDVKEPEDRRRIRKAISLTTFFLIVASVAIIFSSNLGSLGVSLGVASAGIAFALQAVIANAAAWMANSTGAYYKIGDRIQMGGVTGDVIGTNVMVTTVMEIGGWVKADQYNGRVVRISNSNIFTSPVYNYTADFAVLWDEITIPIKYGGDRKLVVEILERVATEVTAEAIEQAQKEWTQLVDKFDVEDARVEPLVTLIANDNWLEYNLRYVTSYHQRRITKSILFNRLMDEFDKVPEKFSIASSTYDIVSFPPVNVNLTHENNKRS